MAIELVYTCIFYINAFPWVSGPEKTLSPFTIVQGRHLNYHKHFNVIFGEYAQTYEGTDNSMKSRTIGAIALGPTGNAQGGVNFFSLLSGRVLDRRIEDYDLLPMPADAIVRVEKMARRSPTGLLFADRNNIQDPDEDDDDDDVDPTYQPSDQSVSSSSTNSNVTNITGVNAEENDSDNNNNEDDPRNEENDNNNHEDNEDNNETEDNANNNPDDNETNAEDNIYTNRIMNIQIWITVARNDSKGDGDSGSDSDSDSDIIEDNHNDEHNFQS